MKLFDQIQKNFSIAAATKIQKLIVAELKKAGFQPKPSKILYRYTDPEFKIDLVVDGKKQWLSYSNVELRFEPSYKELSYGKLASQIRKEILEDEQAKKREAEKKKLKKSQNALLDTQLPIKRKYELDAKTKKAVDKAVKSGSFNEFTDFIKGKASVQDFGDFITHMNELDEPEDAADQKVKDNYTDALHALIPYLLKSKQITKEQHEWLQDAINW